MSLFERSFMRYKMDMMQIKIGIFFIRGFLIPWDTPKKSIQIISFFHRILQCKPSIYGLTPRLWNAPIHGGVAPGIPLLPFGPGFTDLAEEAQGTFIVELLKWGREMP